MPATNSTNTSTTASTLFHRERRAWWILWVTGALVFFWFVVRPLHAPLALATLAAVIFMPAHRRLRRHLPPAAASLASMALVALLLGVPLAGIAVLFVVQIRGVLGELAGSEEIQSRFVDLLYRYLDWLAEFAQRFGFGLDLRQVADEGLRQLGGALYANLPDVLGFAGRLVFGVVIASLALFFLFLRGRAIVELAVELSPLAEDYSQRLLRRLQATIQAVFLGAVLTAVFQGTVGGLGFWLTGFQNFVIWAVLIAGASFIPFIGTSLVWLPAALYLFATQHPGAGFVMLFFGLVISTVDNLLRTLLIHERSAVHPLLVFIALIGGVQTLGPMGLVYGPLIAAFTSEMIRIHRSDFPRRLAASVPAAALNVPSAPGSLARRRARRVRGPRSSRIGRDRR